MNIITKNGNSNSDIVWSNGKISDNVFHEVKDSLPILSVDAARRVHQENNVFLITCWTCKQETANVTDVANTGTVILQCVRKAFCAFVRNMAATFEFSGCLDSETNLEGLEVVCYKLQMKLGSILSLVV